jgi:hypothetical protein
MTGSANGGATSDGAVQPESFQLAQPITPMGADHVTEWKDIFRTDPDRPRDSETIAGKFVTLEATPSFAHVRNTAAP